MTKKRIVDPDGHIICRKCLVIFPRSLDHFAKNNRDSYGMTRVCKKCDNARRTFAEKNKAYHNYPRHCKTCGSFFYASLASMNRTNRKYARKNGGSFCSVECMHKCESISFGMKGKSWNGRRKGSNNPAAILNEEKVKNIRIALMNGDSALRLSNIYGINRHHISSIKNNRSWKHVIVNEKDNH